MGQLLGTNTARCERSLLLRLVSFNSLRDSCPQGHFSGTGSIGCTPCPNGSFAEYQRASQCIPCPHRLSSPAGAAGCTICAENFYLLAGPLGHAVLIAAPDQHCLDCPEHASCPSSTALETIVVDAGHWRLSNASRVITKCEGRNADARCLGGASSGVDGDGYCAPLYTGPVRWHLSPNLRSERTLRAQPRAARSTQTVAEARRRPRR